MVATLPVAVPESARAVGEFYVSAALGCVRSVDVFHRLSRFLVYRPDPDFATLRDRTTSKIKKTMYSVFSLGWRHSNRHWQHYERAYLILAGFATPLVLSVHTIVSFDFAVSVIPGWHTTIFPPYFVAGPFSPGFAMVQNVLIFVRRSST